LRQLAASGSLSTVADAACSTEVIGDVTPFSLTYPYPFFLNCDYFTNGTSYTLPLDKAGQVLVQGLLLAIAGVVQGLMTTEVVTSFVKTPAHTPSIVWAMGCANLVTGFLGGMGGDAMIGLSTINCLNGGKGRLAPTVTAVGVMLCTMVAYPLLNFIPIASLAGVMIVVVVHTFKWAKVPMVISALLPAACRPAINNFLSCNCYPSWMRLPVDVDRWEALVIVVVSSLTIWQNLVYGVGVGLVLVCVRFAWEASQETSVTTLTTSDTSKTYVLQGKLFFGSALRFQQFFDVENDPPSVTLLMRIKPTDYSAQEALQRVTNLYVAAGKAFTAKVEAADGTSSSSSSSSVSSSVSPAGPQVSEKADAKLQTVTV